MRKRAYPPGNYSICVASGAPSVECNANTAAGGDASLAPAGVKHALNRTLGGRGGVHRNGRCDASCVHPERARP
jgi:hypothetical protein